MRKTALILLLTLLTAPLWSLDTENTHLQETDRLIAEKKYESAWNNLHDQAAEIPFSDMMIKKTELCIRYFVMSNMHQMFAFTDIEPDEDLMEYRKNQEGQYDLKLFDPAGGLTAAMEQDPANGELDYWLALYYNDALMRYGESWLKTPEELRQLVVENFLSALSKGYESEELYADLAYTELTMKEWEGGAAHFRKALESDGGNAGYHHNLGIALLNLGELEEAAEHAARAAELYVDASYRADSLFLASSIALNRKDNETVISLLEEGKGIAPRDYRFPDRLIQVYLMTGDTDKAVDNASALFDLYPANPEACSSIIQYFYNFQMLDQADLFFERQIPRYGDSPEALGNLQFHQAVAWMYLEKDSEALAQFARARETFLQVYGEDHQVFGVMEGMEEAVKSRRQP